MWLCALESYPGSLRLTLAKVARDLVPEVLARRRWRRPVSPSQVLDGIKRWERIFSVTVEHIAVERLQSHPFEFLMALQPSYPIVNVGEEQLDQLMAAWRRRDARAPWSRCRTSWLCLMAATRWEKPRTSWEWVLLGLRSQTRALEAFLAEEEPLDHEGDLVFC